MSLEDLDERDLAVRDPRAFIRMHSDKTILDEVQRVPELFSYLQPHTDKVGRTGMYILSGSHFFADGKAGTEPGRSSRLARLASVFAFGTEGRGNTPTIAG